MVESVTSRTEMNLAASDIRKTAAPSKSSGTPIRPPSSGCLCLMKLMISSFAWARLDIGVATSAGATAFTRMF